MQGAKGAVVQMSSKKENPLQRLGALGQSVWLDYIRRVTSYHVQG